MSANKVMTPAEVQTAAADKNNQIRAVDIQLRKKVADMFTKGNQSIINNINNRFITQAIAITEQFNFEIYAVQYDTRFLYKQPINIMNYTAANKIILDEAQTQCNLIGEFVKAQGHNLVSVQASQKLYFGIADIICEFTVVSQTRPTTAPQTPTSGNFQRISGMSHLVFQN